MLQIHVGIQLASLRLPLRKGLLIAAEMGAQAVEIDARNELRPEEISHSGVRELRKIMNDLNLRVSCVKFRTRRGYDSLDDLEPRIEATKKALQLAYDLGSGLVVNHIGSIPAAETDAAWPTLVAALTDIGRHGQKVGAMLAAETGTDSGADFARLMAALPHGSLGIDLNPANLIVQGRDPAELAKAVGDRVIHVHATDATRDVAAARGIVTELGRGSAEFPELLALLEEHQYRGFITIDCQASDNPRTEIAQAMRYLRAL